MSAGAPMSEETAQSAMERAHHFQATRFTRPPDPLRHLPFLAAAAAPPAHQLEPAKEYRAPALPASTLPRSRAEESIRREISRPGNSTLQSPAQRMESPLKFSCCLLQIHLLTHSVLIQQQSLSHSTTYVQPQDLAKSIPNQSSRNTSSLALWKDGSIW